MRVNCCNASECPVSEITVGDTFYLNGRLYIKVAVANVDVVSETKGRCLIVSLDRGELMSVKEDVPVVYAETEVKAFSKVI